MISLGLLSVLCGMGWELYLGDSCLLLAGEKLVDVDCGAVGGIGVCVARGYLGTPLERAFFAAGPFHYDYYMQ